MRSGQYEFFGSAIPVGDGLRLERNSSRSFGFIALYFLMLVAVERMPLCVASGREGVEPDSGMHSSAESTSIRRIGSIEFYGLQRLSAEQLRSILTFKVGDAVTLGDNAFFEQSKRLLRLLPEITSASFTLICCTDDRPVVYVGIQEANTPVMKFRPSPVGAIHLPPEAMQAGIEFEQLTTKAILSGNADEDDSQGHTILADPAARPVEDKLVAIANGKLILLRKVLRLSHDPAQRALAAQILGYVRTMQLVVPDLIYAMSDPSPEVRNNAMRSLWVFTMATKVKPPAVPYRPFVALLNSPEWTDRNKSALALMQMASGRNPELIRALRKRGLSSLVEMARWTDRDHAFASFCILGYIAGLKDPDIFDAWGRNDRERVILAALHSRSDLQ